MSQKDLFELSEERNNELVKNIREQDREVKVITHYYLDATNPHAMEVMIDEGSDLKLYVFDRLYLDEISNDEGTKSNSIVLLINKDVFSKVNEVEVRVSKEGLNVIDKDGIEKWDKCMLITGVNKELSLDLTSYLYDELRHEIKDTVGLKLMNKDLSKKLSSAGYLDRAKYERKLDEISFLISIKGLDLSSKVEPKETLRVDAKPDNLTIEDMPRYFPSSKHKNVKLLVINDAFILKKGSTVWKPKDSMIFWKDDGDTYLRHTYVYEEYVNENLIEDHGDRGTLLKDVSFKSPSGAAALVAGGPTNGWTLFTGLNKYRDLLENR